MQQEDKKSTKKVSISDIETDLTKPVYVEEPSAIVDDPDLIPDDDTMDFPLFEDPEFGENA